MSTVCQTPDPNRASTEAYGRATPPPRCDSIDHLDAQGQLNGRLAEPPDGYQHNHLPGEFVDGSLR